MLILLNDPKLDRLRLPWLACSLATLPVKTTTKTMKSKIKVHRIPKQTHIIQRLNNRTKRLLEMLRLMIDAYKNFNLESKTKSRFVHHFCTASLWYAVHCKWLCQITATNIDLSVFGHPIISNNQHQRQLEPRLL